MNENKIMLVVSKDDKIYHEYTKYHLRKDHKVLYIKCDQDLYDDEKYDKHSNDHLSLSILNNTLKEYFKSHQDQITQISVLIDDTLCDKYKKDLLQILYQYKVTIIRFYAKN